MGIVEAHAGIELAHVMLNPGDIQVLPCLRAEEGHELGIDAKGDKVFVDGLLIG